MLNFWQEYPGLFLFLLCCLALLFTMAVVLVLEDQRPAPALPAYRIVYDAEEDCYYPEEGYRTLLLGTFAWRRVLSPDPDFGNLCELCFSSRAGAEAWIEDQLPL
jgi:hypothetical protein